MYDLGIAVLKDKIIIRIDNSYDQIDFTCQTGEVYRMYHSQDCCESVRVEDIEGDLNDLLNSPILLAEESSNSDYPKPSEYSESYTWTFYKLATIKGYVTIRWLGESNGYYSERVDFVQLNEGKLF